MGRSSDKSKLKNEPYHALSDDGGCQTDDSLHASTEQYNDDVSPVPGQHLETDDDQKHRSEQHPRNSNATMSRHAEVIFDPPPPSPHGNRDLSSDAPWLGLHLEQQTILMNDWAAERKALREENERLREMLSEAEDAIRVLERTGVMSDGDCNMSTAPSVTSDATTVLAGTSAATKKQSKDRSTSKGKGAARSTETDGAGSRSKRRGTRERQQQQQQSQQPQVSATPEVSRRGKKGPRLFRRRFRRSTSSPQEATQLPASSPHGFRGRSRKSSSVQQLPSSRRNVVISEGESEPSTPIAANRIVGFGSDGQQPRSTTKNRGSGSKNKKYESTALDLYAQEEEDFSDGSAGSRSRRKAKKKASSQEPPPPPPETPPETPATPPTSTSGSSSSSSGLTASSSDASDSLAIIVHDEHISPPASGVDLQLGRVADNNPGRDSVGLDAVCSSNVVVEPPPQMGEEGASVKKKKKRKSRLPRQIVDTDAYHASDNDNDNENDDAGDDADAEESERESSVIPTSQSLGSLKIGGVRKNRRSRIQQPRNYSPKKKSITGGNSPSSSAVVVVSSGSDDKENNENGKAVELLPDNVPLPEDYGYEV